MDGCPAVTDEGLAEGLGACRLEVLSLSQCPGVLPAVFEALLRESTLTFLDVTGLP